MTIHWPSKLRHLLQVVLFCLLVAGLQTAFAPQRPFGPPLVYSLLIGLLTWAVIDLGRHLFPSAAETGWPAGATGVLLVIAGIVTGYVVGNAAGLFLCRVLGIFPAGVDLRDEADLRHGILITLVSGMVGSYWFYARSKSAYLLRKMHEATRHATEARLKLLETQLEPHMLFNTLANLRALIAVDPARAQQMLDHMIDYLRATLDGSRTTTHALQAEFDRLRDYLELMAIRMGPRLAYALELPGELQQVAVPALLLQPLVENSIQHGLEPKVRGGRIDVRASRQGKRLLLEVTDTGVGQAGGVSPGPGFGLQQIRDRLQTLYGDTASLEFSCDGEGALARIALPIA
ncbi:histidine kinase [Ramlibacter sp.]|uniref:sensor histidine kinase n=1 Tax=Ramlibacter sp. TaxID=1917967 RepID=UPI00262BA4A4|nr:histidine kinase [Ramlibacter sp.]MDB5955055.1 sensor histidine kinase [Ramlibacter sp.]